jgi:hypothetical protein
MLLIRGCGIVGQFPLSVLDISYEPEQMQILHDRISPSLKFQLQLHRIEMRCCAAMQENGLRHLTADGEKTMEIMLRAFETQLKDIEYQASTGD